MRQVPLLRKRLSKKKQLFYVNCSDYNGEFENDLPSYSQRTSLLQCRHCTHHDTFDTNYVSCNKEISR